MIVEMSGKARLKMKAISDILEGVSRGDVVHIAFWLVAWVAGQHPQPNVYFRHCMDNFESLWERYGAAERRSGDNSH